MYPRTLANKVEIDRLYQMFSSGGAVYTGMIEHWETLLEDEKKMLHDEMERALFDPQVQPHALTRYGRVNMLEQLIVFAKSFKKS